MRHTPRNARLALALVLACVAPQAARAQKGAGPVAQKAADKRPDAAAARARREVRDAVAALREVAEDARAFDDLYASARAQSAAANLLWPFDGQSARAIVRRAWEATRAPGVEGRVVGLGLEQDPEEDARLTVKEARVLIIEATAGHDPRLAEEFMRELERGLNEESEESAQDGQPAATSTHRDGGRIPSKADLERIRVARSLASAGHFQAAAGVVAPLVAKGPTQPLLDFILGLRAGDARAADALCLRLLEVTRADPTADANDVLTLSMPFVSPRLYVLVSADGSPAFGARFAGEEERRAPPLSAELRAAFYAAAAAVLLRPRQSPGGGPPGDAAALYFAIGRLLPFFEREAAQLAPALHARRGALAVELGAARRERVESSSGVSSISVRNPVDPLAHALAEVGLSADAPGRDFARLRAVVTAARHALWERARRVADEIEDAETRRGARLVIAVRQVLNTARAYDDADADDLERAADFVRSADVPPEIRAAGLAQAAGLAAGLGRKARAGELLTEAAGQAAQAERGERRVAATALVVLSAARAEPSRLWELLPTLASAAEETDELPFGALNFEYVVGGEKGRFPFNALDPPVNLPEVFAAAARLDASRALAEARALKDKELRTESLLYASRAALEKHARPSGARTR